MRSIPMFVAAFVFDAVNVSSVDVTETRPYETNVLVEL